MNLFHFQTTLFCTGVLILWEHALVFTAARDLAKIKQRYGSSTPLSEAETGAGAADL